MVNYVNNMIIATRIFNQEDQEIFAELSGDFNPIHLDPIFSRRLLLEKPLFME